ncbi:anhydro-N-acetylmuramic acid kinase-like [Branchiostoma floridae]|uniref:Anhydro-N-acetylmuramic acid kinase-like n=1 Tax=Branchiostoma floridae TaxID=7739 RepID=A0A9J7MTB1_BRAFL|nr:anhydro-N-acetylmuramic acid kinase-like [Branchiostoma floridae]
MESTIKTKRALGLMSGTSMDGIDVALVDIIERDDGRLEVQQVVAETYPYDKQLQEDLRAVCSGWRLTLEELCDLDDRVAEVFAQTAVAVMDKEATKPELIGSHGQTVYHRPPERTKTGGTSLGYSVQLGRGAVLAKRTGVVVVSDFRKADIEVGGQGAPLVPMVDWLLLTDRRLTRTSQNIGGIGNVTYLPANGKHHQVLGFDTGPGNVLIDMAAQLLFNKSHDDGGRLARGGRIHTPLVGKWLEQEFFQKRPPKSTGRELYTMGYLQDRIKDCRSQQLSDMDIMATLTELTVQSIAHSYRTFLRTTPEEVLVSGGGSHNRQLMDRLREVLSPMKVTTTESVGINVDYKEAVAFAVLGYMRMKEQHGNLPSVTGASRQVLLGEVSHP